MPRNLTDPNYDGTFEWQERVVDPDGDSLSFTVTVDGTDISNVSWAGYTTTTNTINGGETEVLLDFTANASKLTSGQTYQFEITADDGLSTTSRTFVLEITGSLPYQLDFIVDRNDNTIDKVNDDLTTDVGDFYTTDGNGINVYDGFIYTIKIINQDNADILKVNPKDGTTESATTISTTDMSEPVEGIDVKDGKLLLFDGSHVAIYDLSNGSTLQDFFSVPGNVKAARLIRGENYWAFVSEVNDNIKLHLYDFSGTLLDSKGGYYFGEGSVCAGYSSIIYFADCPGGSGTNDLYKIDVSGGTLNQLASISGLAPNAPSGNYPVDDMTFQPANGRLGIVHDSDYGLSILDKDLNGIFYDGFLSNSPGYTIMGAPSILINKDGGVLGSSRDGVVKLDSNGNRIGTKYYGSGSGNIEGILIAEN
jgi:hypothetical protein